MCDPAGAVVDVVANVATGGLYSVGKAAAKTVETGSLDPIMTQGLDLGMAATGNTVADDLAGPSAAKAWNAAGSALGTLGSMGAFASTPTGTITPAAAGETTAGSLANESSNIPSATGTINPAAAGDTTAGSLASPPAAADVTPGISPPDSFAQSVDAGTTLSGQPIASPEAAATGPMPSPDAAAASGPPLQSNAPSQVGRMGLMDSAYNVSPNPAYLPPGTPPVTPGNVTGWWNSLDPGTKAVISLVGGQAVTGAAGGLFQGLNAAERLQLDQLINQQRQNQVQYLNKNNAYAPSVTFAPRPGLMNSATPKVST